jgi:hypothetical protein
LLEVKLPKEIHKSPLAMELVLGAMHQTADEGNWYQKYIRTLGGSEAFASFLGQ